MRHNTNTFSNYRELVARFDSAGKCGHPIKKGETIGFNRRHGAQCESCWARWKDENREADRLEYDMSYYGSREFQEDIGS